MRIKIITDSCCDLPLRYLEAHQDTIEVIGMPIVINGKEYIDDLGKTLSHNDFYNLLREGTMPRTSQINVYRFAEAFTHAISNDYAVVYLGLTSGMSGTYNSACLAKQMVEEEYPDARIEVVDTLAASIGLGAMVVEAVKKIESGIDVTALANWLTDNRLNFNHWFGVDNLDYLKNGGRISSASAVVGNMLNVKPTLIVDHDGKLRSYSNVRGRKKSITFLLSKLDKHLYGKSDSTIILGHGNCAHDAIILEEAIKEKYPHHDLIVSELSMTIASHVGPDMIALAFLGDRREN